MIIQSLGVKYLGSADVFILDSFNADLFISGKVLSADLSTSVN